MAGTFHRVEDFDDPGKAGEWLMNKAREAYRMRELKYPIEFALDLTTAMMRQNPQEAVAQFCAWVKARYELEWEPTALPSDQPQKLAELLLEEAKK